MKTFIIYLKSRLIDALTPSATALIATLNKIEAKIERAIDKDARQLEALNAASQSIALAINTKNRDLDTAYKLLHKVSEIAK